MNCNQCGNPMIPVTGALVPALGCQQCGRVVPITGAPPVRWNKTMEARMRRAARRAQMRKEMA